MIKHHQQSGMTLIEILVIVLIVSVGMIATAKFQGELLQVGGTTKARTQALALAQQEIENLRINHDTAANGTEDDVVGVNAEYDRSWTVTVVAGVAGAQQYQSSVTWTDSQNRTQSLQLNTVLYPDNMLSSTESVRRDASNCIFNPSSCILLGPRVEITKNTESDYTDPDGKWLGISDPDQNTTYDTGENKDLNQSITFTDNSDKVYVGKDANVSGGGTDLGGGDNQLYVGKDHNGSITAGAGNDQVEVSKDMNGFVDLGNGNNKLKIGKDANGNLNFGSGSDEVIIKQDANKDFIALGSGNNFAVIGKDSNVLITAGSGNDKVIIGKDANDGPINLGGGNNYLKIGKDANIAISTGSGVDYLYIEKDKNGQAFSTGAGNDYIFIGGNNSANILMGEGDDFICIQGDFYSPIDGGEGNDSIYIGLMSKSAWDNNAWRHKNVVNFENYKFSDGTVVGSAAAFDTKTDGQCLMADPVDNTSTPYVKQYSLSISISFEKDASVTTAELVNEISYGTILGLDLSDTGLYILPISVTDSVGSANITILTTQPIPATKSISAATKWVDVSDVKTLRVTITLVDNL